MMRILNNMSHQSVGESGGQRTREQIYQSYASKGEEQAPKSAKKQCPSTPCKCEDSKHNHNL